MKIKQLTKRERLQNRLDSIELRLMEDQCSILDTIVDPREAYLDDATGEVWGAVGGAGPGALDYYIMPFRNEQELMFIRRKARRQAFTNTFAKNFLRNLVSFVIGPGHSYNVTRRKDAIDDRITKRATVQLSRFLTQLLDVNKWELRQQESYRRYHRDGESIIRRFPQDNGFTLFRFVEPSDLTTPPGYAGENNSFGIRTQPADVESVEAYYVNGEEVPGDEIQHRKANADLTWKRGLSSLYAIETHLESAKKLLRNMAALVQIQSSIALIRHHKGKTKNAVVNFAASKAAFSRTNQRTGQQTKFQKFGPGTVLDSKEDLEYEFPAAKMNASNAIEVLGAELRACASSEAMPEYMVGSDASNANYSSTMVAESPAVRGFESEQRAVIKWDLDLIWDAIRHAVECGRLIPEVLTRLNIEAKPPKVIARDPVKAAQADEIYVAMKAKSIQDVDSELGLDYDQVQENIRAHDDDSPEPVLPLKRPKPGKESRSGRLMVRVKKVLREDKDDKGHGSYPHTDNGNRITARQITQAQASPAAAAALRAQVTHPDHRRKLNRLIVASKDQFKKQNVKGGKETKPPKNKRKLTIDQASAALKAKGIVIGKGHYDLNTGIQSYLLTYKSGKKKWVPADKIKKMIYQ